MSSTSPVSEDSQSVSTAAAVASTSVAHGHEGPATEHVHGPGCSHEHHGHHHAVQPFVRAEPKLGRNDPCSCGSGKKFKKCCAGAYMAVTNGALSARMRLVAATVLLRLFGLWKIPLVFYLQPQVVYWTGERCVLRIKLRRRTKNQLGSMYFASLAAGADLAAGFFAITAIRASGHQVSMVFKNVHAEFLKRADGDVDFACEDGLLIADLVAKTVATGSREEAEVRVTATVPQKRGEEPTATFRMMLSVKKAG